MKKLQLFSNKKGFTLIEIMLAVSIFGVIVVGALGSILYGQQAQLSSGLRNRALLVADQSLDIVRSLRDQGIDTLRDGTYGLTPVGTTWSLTPGGDTVQGFRRVVSISSSNGGDQKNISVTVSWENDFTKNGSVTLSMTLTNWTAPVPVIQTSSARSGVMTVSPSTGFTATMIEGSNSISNGSQTYTITNSGSASLSWTVAYAVPHPSVSLSQSSGTLAPGESTNVTASYTSSAYAIVTADGVGPSTYSRTIQFTNTTNGSGNTTRTQSITVTTTSAMQVTPGTDFTVTGTAPFTSTQDYVIENTGPVSMNWHLTYEQNWMEITGPLAGVLAPHATATITVIFNANANALANGDYSSYINFYNDSSGVGDTTRTVYLHVGAGGDGGGHGGGTVGGKKIWSDNDGRYLYMITTDKRFQVYDITDPTTPSLKSELTFSSILTNIFVKGAYAYVTLDDPLGELAIIDISDPNNPSLTGTYDAVSPGDDSNLIGNDVWVGTSASKNYAILIASNTDGTTSVIDMISLENPAIPASLSMMDSTGILYEIAAKYDMASGNTGYAFVSSDADTAEVQAYKFKLGTSMQGLVGTYDITGKNTPRTIGFYTDGASRNNVVVGNNQTVFYLNFNEAAIADNIGTPTHLLSKIEKYFGKIAYAAPTVLELGAEFTDGHIKNEIYDLTISDDGKQHTYLAVPTATLTQLKKIDFSSLELVTFEGEVDADGETTGITYDASINYVFGSNSTGNTLGPIPKQSDSF